MQICYVRHLNDEQNARAIPFSGGAGQTPQMLRAPEGGGVGEGADTVFLQRHAFDLQKPELSVPKKGKIKPGIAVNGLRPEGLDFPKAAGEQPLFGRRVGRLGVHIDETAAFLNGNQVKAGFSGRGGRLLTPDTRSGDKQLLAASGVFYVDGLCLPGDVHIGDKPVGAGKKRAGYHIGVVHFRSFGRKRGQASLTPCSCARISRRRTPFRRSGRRRCRRGR